MFNRTTFALLASGTLLAAPVAAAQRWGYEQVPDAGAGAFYQEPNYRGPYFCARAGEDMPIYFEWLQRLDQVDPGVRRRTGHRLWRRSIRRFRALDRLQRA